MMAVLGDSRPNMGLCSLGAKTSPNHTAAETETAYFWADGASEINVFPAYLPACLPNFAC